MTSLIDKDLGFKAIIRSMQHLDRNDVNVGVTGVKAKQIHRNAKIPVSQLAAQHELGIAVPRRAFVGPTTDQNADLVLSRLKTSLARLKNVRDARASLKGAGEFLAQKMRDKIDAGVPPRLSERSISRKARTAPQNALTPLKETNQMYDAITFRLTNA